jgi:uncharacterized protein with GYD domain
MATYFLFGKYSAEAIKEMSPGRTEKANKLIQKFGGEVKSIYALLGERDLLIIANFPGTEQAVKSSIAVSKLTGISFTTSEAIAVEDFDRMISDL